MDVPFGIIFGLLIIVCVVYFFRNKKNLKLISETDKSSMSDEIAFANKNERWLLWILILLFPLVILLDSYYRVNNLDLWISIYFGITAIVGVLAVFRNRKIHQKLNFPKSFVQSEFSLSLLIAVLLATLILYSIWQDIK